MMELAKRVKRAAEAQCNLNTFYAVIGVLENGTIRGEHSQPAAQRIIKICKEQAQRELDRYDRQLAAIEQGWVQ